LPHRIYGDEPFSIHASASSGLPVSFSVVFGPATIAENIVTLTGTGQVTIQAAQAGDATYNAARFANQSFMVNKAHQTITLEPLPNKTYGDAPFAVNATSSSGLPVTFSVLSGPAVIVDNLITLTGAGRVMVQASHPGNDNYYATYVNKSFLVADPPRQNQTIVFDAIADKTYGEAPFVVNAIASSGLPVVYNIVSGPATIAENIVTLTGAGQVIIRATQAGDAGYNATHMDTRFTVYPAEPVAQDIRFDPIADKTYGDAPFAISAMASSGLPVTYTVVSGPATIEEDTVTLTGAGEVIIRVDQAGNADFLAAPAMERVFCVAPPQPVITIEGSTAICVGASVVLQAPAGFSAYVWSNGETTQNISVTAPGEYTVKVKAETCESVLSQKVTITESPGIIASAGNDTTVYHGYAPAQCTQLAATASGGEAPYTYLWSTGATTDIIEVCPDQTTSYTVTITDSKGCSATDEVVVNAIDIRCGNKMDKVMVCNQEKIRCISANAVPAHLAQGYELGMCAHDPATMTQPEEPYEISVYPNPFRQQTTIEFEVEETAHATLEIYTSSGILLYRLFDETAYAGETYKVEFNRDNLAGGLYIAKLSTKNTVRHKRIMLTK